VPTVQPPTAHQLPQSPQDQQARTYQQPAAPQPGYDFPPQAQNNTPQFNSNQPNQANRNYPQFTPSHIQQPVAGFVFTPKEGGVDPTSPTSGSGSKKVPIVDKVTRIPLEIPARPTHAPTEPRERRALPIKDPITREEIPVHQQPVKTKALPIKDPITRKVIEFTPAVAPETIKPTSPTGPATGAVSPVNSSSSPTMASSKLRGWTGQDRIAPAVEPQVVKATIATLPAVEPSPQPAPPVEAPTPAVSNAVPAAPLTNAAAAITAAVIDQEAAQPPAEEPTVEEEDEEDQEDSDEDEEKGDAHMNGDANALLTQKDTWGFFATIAAKPKDRVIGNGSLIESLSLNTRGSPEPKKVVEPSTPEPAPEPAPEPPVPAEPVTPPPSSPVHEPKAAETAAKDETSPTKEDEKEEKPQLYRRGSRPPSPGISPPVSPLGLGIGRREAPKPTGVSGVVNTDAVVLAPRASWSNFAVTNTTTNQKKPLEALRNDAIEPRAKIVADEKPGVPLDRPNPNSTKRTYTREFMLSRRDAGGPATDMLKKCECYTGSETRRMIGRQQMGGMQQKMVDSRSIFGNKTVPGKPEPKYDALDGKRADTAFNRDNTKKLDSALKVLNKVRGILNRIAAHTYAVLSEEMWTILNTHKLMESTEMLEQVVATIFEVALTQANFGSLSADICHFLCTKIKGLKQQKEDGTELPPPLSEFRRLLLNKCQNMFDLSCNYEPLDTDGMEEAEKEEKIKKEESFKVDTLANITFMAQLFNRSLLSEKIMHMHVIGKLLGKDHTDDKNSWLLEFLLKLLELTGKKLDREAATGTMDGYFRELVTISRRHPDVRLRHLTFNIIEMRRAGWRTREQVKQSEEQSMASRARAAEWERAQADVKKKEELAAAEKAKANAKSAKEDKKNAKKNERQAATASASASASAAKPAPEAQVDELTEEMQNQIEGVAKATLGEFGQNLLTDEDLASGVKADVPAGGLPHLIACMVSHCVGSNKLKAERENFPKIAAILLKSGSVKKQAIADGLVLVVERAVEYEQWVDVPKLWSNLGDVLCDCIVSSVADFDVLAAMVVPILKDEEQDPAVATDFLNSVLQVLQASEWEEFDPEKAGRLLMVAQKKEKKKGKKAPKVNSIEDLMEALEKLRSA